MNEIPRDVIELLRYIRAIADYLATETTLTSSQAYELLSNYVYAIKADNEPKEAE